MFAEGGIGRIFRARDMRLGREVALKELRDPDDAYHEARFVREAMLTARLQHPSIVPIYEAGRWPDGRPFYAMKLVSGRSLDRMIAAAPTLAQRLALVPHVLAVAEAMAYAHGERIIHRDLKPANVLVGAFGETLVIDWGLARDLDAPLPSVRPPADMTEEEEGRLTEMGAVIGTPEYMAPEQGRGEDVDERADVYAVGALLYHVLAGRPPYQGTTPMEVFLCLHEGPPIPLEQQQPGVPRELSTIVGKAMAREPADRYPTAKELADDLRRFLTGQIVAAHHYSPAERTVRFIQRNRAALAVAMIVVGFLLTVVAVRVAGLENGASNGEHPWHEDHAEAAGPQVR
jgi:serine/threonine protein kinase